QSVSFATSRSISARPAISLASAWPPAAVMEPQIAAPMAPAAPVMRMILPVRSVMAEPYRVSAAAERGPKRMGRCLYGWGGVRPAGLAGSADRPYIAAKSRGTGYGRYGQ